MTYPQRIALITVAALALAGGLFFATAHFVHRKDSVPVVWHGVELNNGCFIAAIKACKDLQGTDAKPQVLLLKYTLNGVVYGHVETFFHWPGEGKPSDVRYLFDENHGSFPLPNTLDATDPMAVAKYAIPSTTVAWWADPDSTPTPK